MLSAHGCCIGTGLLARMYAHFPQRNAQSDFAATSVPRGPVAIVIAPAAASRRSSSCTADGDRPTSAASRRMLVFALPPARASQSATVDGRTATERTADTGRCGCSLQVFGVSGGGVRERSADCWVEVW